MSKNSKEAAAETLPKRQQIVLSGTKPTESNLHIGNYFGALRQMVDLQDQHDDSVYFVADYHSMTSVRDGAERRANTEAVALDYLGAGLDPMEAVVVLARAKADAVDGGGRPVLAADTIVSLETIEHLESDPGDFITHLGGLLRPGGILVASVPTTPSVDVNPHHHHDFTDRSFRRMFEERGFVAVETFPQVQPVDVFAVASGKETRLADVRPNLLGYYLTNPGALARRIGATLRTGFANHYVTIAWERP